MGSSAYGGYNPIADASTTAISDTARQANYRRFQDYYNGRHVSQLPGPDQKLPSITALKDFSANICDVIVDSLAERLELSSFNVSDDADNAQARQIMKWWELDHCDHMVKTVHTNVLMQGDSYVIVEWDNDEERPMFVFNPATLITLKYADVANKRLEYACKTWIEDDKKKAFKYFYYPDHIEKYSCILPEVNSYMIWPGFMMPNMSAMKEWVLDESTPWVNPKTGKPLGIAVIPFKNQAHGAIYGRSELANVISLQDAINKVIVDMLLAMDFSAYPLLVIKGNIGDKKFKFGPGLALSSDNPDFAVDRIQEGGIAAFIQALELFINLVFGRSRIPKYFTQIEGNLPSGESIKSAQEGFISKIKDRQEDFGDSWENCLYLACRLDNAFGTGTWDLKNLIIHASWTDAENRLALHWAQAISTLAPWLSWEEILRKQGYDEERIKQIMSEQLANKKQENDLGAQKIAAFNAGQLPNGSQINLSPAPGHQGANRNPERQPQSTGDVVTVR